MCVFHRLNIAARYTANLLKCGGLARSFRRKVFPGTAIILSGVSAPFSGEPYGRVVLEVLEPPKRRVHAGLQHGL